MAAELFGDDAPDAVDDGERFDLTHCHQGLDAVAAVEAALAQRESAGRARGLAACRGAGPCGPCDLHRRMLRLMSSSLANGMTVWLTPGQNLPPHESGGSTDPSVFMNLWTGTILATG